MNSGYGNNEITFEILEHIGVVATFPTGWKKEINLVSWNGAAGKYDIREWDPSHERMSRGITLKENEMRILLDLMRRRRRPIHQIDGFIPNDGIEHMESNATSETSQDIETPFDGHMSPESEMTSMVEERLMDFDVDESVEKELAVEAR